MHARSRFRPVVAPMLRSRTFVLAIAGASILQIGATGLGLPGWRCPIVHLLGIPCPGCGLTCASIALLRGDWDQALTIHLYAPVLLLALASAVVISLLPEDTRVETIRVVERTEARTGFSHAILLGLMAYWVVRSVAGMSGLAAPFGQP